MNTSTPTTITINITGQLTIDPKNLDQVLSGLKIQTPSQTPAPPTDPTKLPRLAYSIKETAKIIGVSEKSVRRLIDRGILKSSKALRHIRITHAEIERFLKATTA